MLQNELIIQEPRQRKQTARYGNDDSMMEISDLDSTSNSDDEDEESRKTRSGIKKRGRPGRKRRGSDDDYDADDAEGYGRSDCFKVEKNLLVYGWDILCVLTRIQENCFWNGACILWLWHKIPIALFLQLG